MTSIRARVIVCLALSLSVLGAFQYTLPEFPQNFSNMKYARGTYLSSSPTSVATHDVVLNFLLLSNDDASATATVRVVDGSTACGGAACPIVPDVSLAPKTVYVVPLDSTGIFSPNGLSWSATGSTKVFGYLRLRY